MKLIKVIDLINKVASNEAPETISYMNSTYKYDNDLMDYEDVETKEFFFNEVYNTRILNDEVEIIEYKKIGNFTLINPSDNEKILANKINEIIDKIYEDEKK